MTEKRVTTAYDVNINSITYAKNEFNPISFVDRYQSDCIIYVYANNYNGIIFYECVFCEDDNKVHLNSSPNDKFANVQEAMITGAIKAFENVGEFSKVFLVTPTHLGFKGAAKDQGLNVDGIKTIISICKKKHIQLNEVVASQSDAKIRQFVKSFRPMKTNDANINFKPIYDISNGTRTSTEHNILKKNRGVDVNTIPNFTCSGDLEDMLFDGELTAANLNLGGLMGELRNFESAVKLAHDFGTETIMLFVDNAYFDFPNTKLLNGKKMVLHGPLSINMAAEDDSILQKSRERLLKIINRCNWRAKDIAALVLHPGNADSEERLIETLKELLAVAKFPIALETMSGQGRELGVTFDQLVSIKEKFGNPDNLKFCVDTCHIFSAGYDISNPVKAINYISQKLGVENIAVIHLNDSATECGSNKDMHAHIGAGHIPVKALRAIVKAKVFLHIPKILETPKTEIYGVETYDYDKDIEILLK